MVELVLRLVDILLSHYVHLLFLLQVHRKHVYLPLQVLVLLLQYVELQVIVHNRFSSLSWLERLNGMHLRRERFALSLFLGCWPLRHASVVLAILCEARIVHGHVAAPGEAPFDQGLECWLLGQDLLFETILEDLFLDLEDFVLLGLFPQGLLQARLLLLECVHGVRHLCNLIIQLHRILRVDARRVVLHVF